MSITHTDAFFGGNHSFNQTLWDEFVDFSNQFSKGKYNLTVAAELHFQHIQDSIAINPQFSFISPHFMTAYGESVFPIQFFIDSHQMDGQLDLNTALRFFRDMRFPDRFFRANGSRGAEGLDVVANAHPICPGANQGTVNGYTPDPDSTDFSDFCRLYSDFVNKTVKGLYPSPKGVLKVSLNRKLDFLYKFINTPTCSQVFPFGK